MVETLRTREKEIINSIRSGLVDPQSRGDSYTDTLTATASQTTFELRDIGIKYVDSITVNGALKEIGYHYRLDLGEGNNKSNVIFKTGLDAGDTVVVIYHYGQTMLYEGFQRLESSLPRMSMILNGASSEFIAIGENGENGGGKQKIWNVNYQIEVRSSYAAQLKSLLNELSNLMDSLRQNTPQLYKTLIITDVRYANYDFDNMLRLYRGRVFFTVKWIVNFKWGKTFIKGFRTNMAYFPQTDYDEDTTFAVTADNAYKVGGNIKSLNWTARHNIIKTGSIGDGRNYKQQLYGTYDANGSINWEVSDLSFFRFGVGDIADIAKFGTGASDSQPYAIIDAELTGVDSSTESNTALSAGDVTDFSTVRIRPFSILAYDTENATGSSDYNESVDLIYGAMMTDINVTASIGTPLMATTNFVARNINFKRNLPETMTPVFTDEDESTDDGTTYAKSPALSQAASQEAPLMFYQGEVQYGGNKLALVQSFNLSLNNNFRIFRGVGDKFIKMPTTGMRNFTATVNMLFSLPNSDADLRQGKPNVSETSILEIIKNYLGYESEAPFPITEELTPTPDSVPAETKTITLKFEGTNNAGNDKGAEINLYNVVPEGFGHPVQLENGMVEIAVTFNVIGYPFNKTGDGSYTGFDPEDGGTDLGAFNPMFKFWTS